MNIIFDNAQSVREVCSGTYKTEAALMASIIAAIAAVVATGELFTCTVSTSAKTSQDVQNCIQHLRESFYTTSLAGSTLTISW